jgi:histidinol-phosphate/aromatic aminotransferase/cobyric acid decarboxylase-like protein
MTGFRFPNYIRVTISTLDVMEAFIEALAKVLR